MTVATSTLRPGLLISLKTSVTGNTSYKTLEIEGEHRTADGGMRARWETERTIADPDEHEEAIKVRSKVRSLITAECSASAFGLLCPEAAGDNLNRAVAEARSLADEFNSRARLTRIQVFVIAGRIAADDVEAMRAINSEIRDLMTDMERGLSTLDVKVVREAAGKAKALGSMLSVEAAARVQLAVETARSAARRLVKAGEEGSMAIDKAAIARIVESRTMFLDLTDAQDIATPATVGRAVDLQALAERWPDVDDVGAALTAVRPPAAAEIEIDTTDHPNLCDCRACIALYGDTAVAYPAPTPRVIELD